MPDHYRHPFWVAVDQTRLCRVRAVRQGGGGTGQCQQCVEPSLQRHLAIAVRLAHRRGPRHQCLDFGHYDHRHSVQHPAPQAYSTVAAAVWAGFAVRTMMPGMHLP